MRAFEIHTFRDGQWKVDSVFDDRELALHEARKVDDNGRYAGVRVIEETYDDVSDLTKTKTIFRGKKEAAKKKAARYANMAPDKNAKGGVAQREPERKPRRKQQQQQNSNNTMMMVLMALVLLLTGVVALFGIHYFSTLK